MSLRDLKVGDEVFVVNQKRRHGDVRSTTNAKIVRVGRKYAYIKPYGHAELPFCRESGCSVHTDDSNARVNGFGFDVYRSQADYEAEELAAAEFLRLQARICSPFNGLRKLPPGIVFDIHAVLDAYPEFSE